VLAWQGFETAIRFPEERHQESKLEYNEDWRWALSLMIPAFRYPVFETFKYDINP